MRSLLPIRGSSPRSGVRGCNGVSARPLRPASRSTSPWKVEELQALDCSPKGELPAKPTEGLNGGSGPVEPVEDRGQAVGQAEERAGGQEEHGLVSLEGRQGLVGG